MLVASERAASAFHSGVQLRRLEAHVISQTAQEGKERLPARFVLCPHASDQAASAFLSGVQLQGLEAHVISQIAQEGKERLPVRFVLCHTPLTKLPPLFGLSSSGG
jgi:hypothetical protein